MVNTFIGDSLTAHLGALSDWFGLVAADWVNLGIGGQLSYEVLARIATVSATTEKCVVLAGINDIVAGAGTGGERLDVLPPGTVTNGFASTASYLQQIYEALEARGIQPLPATLPPVCYFQTGGVNRATSGEINAQILLLNDWIRTYAAAHDLDLIDYYPHFVGSDGYGLPELYIADGLHPNPQGRAVSTCVAGSVLFGTTTWTRGYVDRDFPPSSGDTVLMYRGLINGVATPRNVDLRVGAVGYTGTSMTDAQLDLCARNQASEIGQF